VLEDFEEMDYVGGIAWESNPRVVKMAKKSSKENVVK
jgi:hypothetical protein